MPLNKVVRYKGHYTTSLVTTTMIELPSYSQRKLQLKIQGTSPSLTHLYIQECDSYIYNCLIIFSNQVNDTSGYKI